MLNPLPIQPRLKLQMSHIRNVIVLTIQGPILPVDGKFFPIETKYPLKS
ncbi:MAG: hypothetical protein QOI07_3962 [Verrucomicrobiota bacterium]